MARTALTRTAGPTPYGTAGVDLFAGEAGADVGNGNYTPCTGRELVIVRNTDAAPQTITITSAADPFGRLGSITADSITNGHQKIYGPFPVDGWAQSDGSLYISGSSANLMIAVIVLP